MWFWLKSKYWHVFTKMIWLELLTYWVSWNLILVGNRVIGLVFGSKTTAKVYQLFCQFLCTRVQRTIQSSITLCREDSSPWHPFCAGDIHSNLLPGRGRQTNRPSLQTNGTEADMSSNISCSNAANFHQSVCIAHVYIPTDCPNQAKENSLTLCQLKL